MIEELTTETTTTTETEFEGELLSTDPRCRVAISLWMDGESVEVEAESDDMNEAASKVMEMFYAVRLSWRGKALAPSGDGE